MLQLGLQVHNHLKTDLLIVSFVKAEVSTTNFDVEKYLFVIEFAPLRDVQNEQRNFHLDNMRGLFSHSVRRRFFPIATTVFCFTGA